MAALMIIYILQILYPYCPDAFHKRTVQYNVIFRWNLKNFKMAAL